MRLKNVLLAFVLAGSFVFGASAFSPTVPKKAVAQEESEVLLNFQIVSDVHYETGRSNYQFPKFAEKFRNALTINAEQFPDSDALVVAGDVTYTGREEEYQGFFGDLKRYCAAPVNIVAFGNHEYEWDESRQKLTSRSDADFAIKEERYKRFVKEYSGYPMEQIYFDTWVNGYHFIVLNSEAWVNGNGDAYISEAQLAWLKRALAQRADENKPIFVIGHQPLSDTINRSDAWPIGAASKRIKELFADYPQVIYFSGHVHNGLIGYKAVYNAGYGTLLDLPAFQYNELDNTESGSAIGYNVSVYADKTLLTPIDYVTEKLLTDETIVVDKAFYAGAASAADLDGVSVSVNGAADSLLTDGRTDTVTSINGDVMLSLPEKTKISGLRFRSNPITDVQGSVGIWGAYDMQNTSYTSFGAPDTCKVSVSNDGETWTEVADAQISVEYGTSLSNANREGWADSVGWARVSFGECEAKYVRAEFDGGCVLSEIRLTGKFTPSFPDTYEIQTLYEGLMNADVSKYTQESIQTVQAEIQQLKTFVYGTSVSEKEVAQVLGLLKNAESKLVEKTDSPPVDSSVDSSSDSSSSATDGTSTSANGSGSGSGGCGSAVKPLAFLAAIAVATGFFIGRKNKKGGRRL